MEHSDAVTTAVSEILQMMCGVEVTVSQGEDVPSEDGGVILAVITIVGDLEWAVYVGLPRQTAEALAPRFAGFEIPFDSPDMGDAVGELTNIIVGQTKTLLDRKGLDVEISLPSVMRADSLEVLVQSDLASQRTCYSSEVGPLWTGLVAGNR